MSGLELKIPPPVMAATTALLLYSGDRLSPQPWRVEVSPWLIGLTVMIALLVGAAAVAHFFRAGTTVHPHCPEKSEVLVARGIYRYSRNPMYLSLLLILIAWSMHLGWVGAPLLWALFVVWITRFQIRPEERVLAQLFGDDYRAYCDRVRRWL
ncbi:MAG: isoprenylcysteine carboxylmethyltransferase family protein [Oceanospirillales bacterium]|nr:isoprenylcysteine carboxylmethyltransferase family protein [Oceanospirillales bacterium]